MSDTTKTIAEAKQHDTVQTVADHGSRPNGTFIGAGSKGTVVYVYGSPARAFEVEFHDGAIAGYVELFRPADLVLA